MKRLLFCCLLSGTLAGNAQDHNHPPVANRLRIRPIPEAISTRQPGVSRVQSGSQVIWSSDFSNPADWITGKAAGTNDNWTINSLPPGGPFSIGTIQSATRANGFAKFDSDLGCSGNQHAWVGMAQPVSLASFPFAILEFQQYYSKYIDSTFIDVSTNGTSWVSYEVNGQYSNNDLSPNPETVQLNISAAAGNQPLVWVRFRFYSSTTTMGAGAGCGYAWMVDDVKILKLPDNDLVLEDHELIPGGKLLFYGRTPSNQLSDSIRFAATAHNFGAAAQTGTFFYAQVRNDNGTARFSDTSRLNTPLAVENRDTSASSQWFQMAGTPVGRYNYVIGYATDSVDATPTNNFISRNFYVTDTTYRLSSDFSRTNGLSTESWSYAKDDLRMAVLYEVTTPDTLTSVTLRLTANTQPGAYIVVTIRDTLGLFTNYSGTLQNPNSFAPFLVSDDYFITAADTAAGFATITIPAVLSDGSSQDRLLAVGAYYVSAALFSNNGVSEVGILDDESFAAFMPPYASLTFIPADPADPGSTQRWWTNGTAHAIYANFGTDGAVSVDEQPLLATQVKLYPNPASSRVQLDFQLLQPAKVTLRIRDLQGREMHQHALPLLQPGDHRQELDLSSLAGGLYLLELQAGNSYQHLKLIVQP